MEVKLTTKQDISGENIKEKFRIDVVDGFLVIQGETYQYVCIDFEELLGSLAYHSNSGIQRKFNNFVRSM